MKPGELLQNGATCIVSNGQFILAVWEQSVYHPFVTWELHMSGNVEHGHYFNDIDEAVRDYHDRCESQRADHPTPSWVTEDKV
jgi:hypothetical protein